MSDDPAKKKTCFVVSPIGAEGSLDRQRADKVLRHIIVPPLEDAGYSVTRADKIADPGLISSQVIERIAEDDLVIADLTDHNPNVFYELAIRHAIGKPFIQLIDSSQNIPFDIAGFRTILFDHRDLDSAFQARLDIAKQIEVISDPQFKVVTPLSFTADLNSLRASGDAEQVAMSKMFEVLSSIQAQIYSLEHKVSASETTSELVDTVRRQNERLLQRVEAFELAARGEVRSNPPLSSRNALSGLTPGRRIEQGSLIDKNDRS